MTYPSTLEHPQWGWSLDFSAALESDLDSLPWQRVFRDLKDTEDGVRVNQDENRQVGHFWLRDPATAPTMKQALDIGDTSSAVVDWIHKIQLGELLLDDAHPITDVIHIGMGGSSLGPEFLVQALGNPEARTIHFLDNVDAHTVANLVTRLKDRLSSTLILVLSKSGSTLETMMLCNEVFRRFREAGHRPERRAVAITQPHTSLAQRATKEKWLNMFPIWDWVGGRFSFSSAVGLVTAGLAGVDIQSLLLGAKEMDQWTRRESPLENPAARLAALWYTQRQGPVTRDFVVMPYADRLKLVSNVLQQLLMESLGKGVTRMGAHAPQGLAVYGNKGSSDQHALVQQLVDGQDRALILLMQVLDDGTGPLSHELSLGDTMQHFLLGTRRALMDRKRPVLTWTLPTLDAAGVGATLALFERAVGIYASLVDINAYHQPGVEAGKRAAKTYATAQETLLTLLTEQPHTLHALQEQLDVDPIEVRFILSRLAQTHRIHSNGDPSNPLFTRTP